MEHEIGGAEPGTSTVNEVTLLDKRKAMQRSDWIANVKRVLGYAEEEAEKSYDKIFGVTWVVETNPSNSKYLEQLMEMSKKSSEERQRLLMGTWLMEEYTRISIPPRGSRPPFRLLAPFACNSRHVCLAGHTPGDRAHCCNDCPLLEFDYSNA
jgi:hypothetical protein